MQMTSPCVVGTCDAAYERPLSDESYQARTTAHSKCQGTQMEAVSSLSDYLVASGPSDWVEPQPYAQGTQAS